MENKEQKQEPKEALNKDRNKFLKALAVENGAGQEYIDYVLEQSKTAPIDVKKEVEITRKAAKIMNNEKVQDKVNELYAEISEQLKKLKQEEVEVYVKELLDGDSPHEETAAYYAKNAHKYERDEKGNYVLRDEYVVGAVGLQISSELLTKSRETKKQEANADDKEIDEK